MIARRTLGALGALMTLVALPDRVRAETPPALAATTFALPNGLEVVLQPDTAVSSVVVHTWHRVGHETATPGLARLFESLMFRGSRHVADGAFESLVDATGGWTDATTASEHASTITSVPAGALPLVLQLEAERMAGLGEALDQRRLDAARTARPAATPTDTIRAALYPARPAADGDPTRLAAVTLDGARAFWRDHYGPARTLLVITGRFDPIATRALVTRLYGWMPGTAPAREPAIAIEPATAARDLRIVDDVPGPKVIVAFRTPAPLDPASPALAIAARLLGTGTRARLHTSLVAARLATEVRVDLAPDRRGGLLTIEVVLATGVDPATAIAATRAELARLRDTELDAAELARVKTAADASLVESLENLAFRAEAIARWTAWAASPNFLAPARAAIAEVTAAGVREIATTWFAERAALTVIVAPRRAP